VIGVDQAIKKMRALGYNIVADGIDALRVRLDAMESRESAIIEDQYISHHTDAEYIEAIADAKRADAIRIGAERGAIDAVARAEKAEKELFDAKARAEKAEKLYDNASAMFHEMQN